LVTIAVSTYMILYSQPLYDRLAPWLTIFERRRPHRELAMESKAEAVAHASVLVFGLGRYGGRLLLRLHEQGIPVVGVDFDPEVVRALRHKGLPVYFGDGEDAGFLESLPVKQARWVVTTLPQWEGNRALLHALREAGFANQVAGVVRDDIHASALHRAGVNKILNPFTDAADLAAHDLSLALSRRRE
jgi:Trk K+ transport system NAD-binding subunit